MISKLRAGWDTLSRASSNSSITTLDKLEEALSLTLSITSCMMILWMDMFVNVVEFCGISIVFI